MMAYGAMNWQEQEAMLGRQPWPKKDRRSPLVLRAPDGLLYGFIEYGKPTYSRPSAWPTARKV